MHPTTRKQPPLSPQHFPSHLDAPNQLRVVYLGVLATPEVSQSLEDSRHQQQQRLETCHVSRPHLGIKTCTLTSDYSWDRRLIGKPCSSCLSPNWQVCGSLMSAIQTLKSQNDQWTGLVLSYDEGATRYAALRTFNSLGSKLLSVGRCRRWCGQRSGDLSNSTKVKFRC